MERLDLGGDDVTASRIGLGTWAIGGWMWGGADEAESIRAIQSAPNHGVTLIDTAPVYGFGRPEQLAAVDNVWGWQLDDSARERIAAIVDEHVHDPVGPEFMAPPARAA